MANRISGQIDEIGRNIEDLAGYELRRRVMAGCEKVIASPNPARTAAWLKGALERLDALVDESTRKQIMLNCGYNCLHLHPRPVEAAKARRRKYADEQAFLAAEIQKPPRGMRFERSPDGLIQYFTPHAFGSGMRCYCSLLRGLPPGQAVSPTYCECSRGFVQKYWEEILGREVQVDLVGSAVSGECKFVVQL
jgi:hypothetical protein